MNDLMFINMIERQNERYFEQRKRAAEAPKAEAAPAKAAKAEAAPPVCRTIETYTDSFNTCWYKLEEVSPGNHCITEFGTVMEDDSYVQCSHTDCFEYPSQSGAAKQGDFWGALANWLGM